jgi:hypothetical protein
LNVANILLPILHFHLQYHHKRDGTLPAMKEQQIRNLKV